MGSELTVETSGSSTTKIGLALIVVVALAVVVEARVLDVQVVAVLVAQFAVLFHSGRETNATLEAKGLHVGSRINGDCHRALCNLHVIERETLEGPLVEALLFALVQAVHCLQPLDELLPHSSSTSHLREKIRIFSLSICCQPV